MVHKSYRLSSVKKKKKLPVIMTTSIGSVQRFIRNALIRRESFWDFHTVGYLTNKIVMLFIFSLIKKNYLFQISL